MRNRSTWLSLLALCAACAIGCKKSNNNGGAAGTAGDFGGSGFGAAGMFGSSGSTGTSGAGAAGKASSSNVPCGSTTCMDPYMIGMPCCADPATGTCGVGTAAACMPRAKAEPKCPGNSMFMVVGCCLPDGTTCGIDGYPVMAGCQSIESLRMFMLPLPAATHCDGTPIMMGTAGMGAAGGGTAGAAGAAGHAGGGGAAGHAGGGGAAGHSGAGGAAGR